MVYRKMLPSDREEMVSFFADMGEVSTGFFNRGHGNEKVALKFIDSGLPNYEFYVMEHEGKIIGYTFTWDMDKTVPWFGIAVRDDWHGKLVGTEMLSATLVDLENRGYGGLLLTTAQNNFKGQGLYEKCGFERLGVHPTGEFLYLRRFDK
ncbi:MAG: GNAT family N-acetyltransferase [Clostridia bacterium]|nr:GNAT family N-acetyltransferase [Clostridia bacterium]